jgi:hypothetical protein
VIRQHAFVRRYPTAIVFAAALIIISVVGCGGGSKTGTVIPFTPTGTYQLTVQGSAQDGARGYTCTLVVASSQ